MSKQRSLPPGRPRKALTYSAPALEKGLDVIELLSQQPNGLAKSQIARELNRTVSEILRMLLCLEHRGYVTQISRERYSLTLKLLRLAQKRPPTERLIADAIPVMQRLANDTLQSCHLGVLGSYGVVILAQANAPSALGFFVKLASTIDLMDAATGHVVLAHLSAEQRDRAVAEWHRRSGKEVPRDLEAHLIRIRTKGYEKRDSYLIKGVVDLSFPILGESGSAVGALTIPYINRRGAATTMNQIIRLMRAAAAEITGAIGGISMPKI
jgi:DNA-binding IclR family transcriptional regulator